MACRYAADNADELNGLVLHASYCDRDVSESGLRVLSVLGAADGVLDAEGEREPCEPPTGDAGRRTRRGQPRGFGAYGPQRGDRPVATEPAAMRERVGNATGAWLAG